MGKGSRNRELRISDNQVTSDSEVKLSRKQLVKQQEKKERIKKYVTMGAAIVIIAALIVAIVVVSVNRAPKLEKQISGTSEEYEIDNAMMAYLMYSNYHNFVQQNYYYLDLAQLGLDPQKPLKAQKMYGGDTTWFEFFLSQAKKQVKEYVALATEANKKGYKLDEEEEKDIKDAISGLKDAAKQQGYPSVNKFLAANYVTGVTASSIEKCFRLQQLAAKYYKDLIDSYKYTDEEMSKYVEDNPEKFYKFDIISYPFNPEYEKDATEAEKEAALKEAKAKAEDFLENATDEKAFREMINELEKAKEDEKPKESESGTGSSEESKDKDYSEKYIKEGAPYEKDDDFTKWAFDKDRKAGDKTVIEIKDSNKKVVGYQVYYLKKTAYKDDYFSQDVRHILVKGETEEESKAEAEKILEEYKKGEMTEDAFAELAKKYSKDNAEDGGLYEEILKGQMETEFNDWIFDEKRKPGDVDIVKTQYGEHIMYYVGTGREAWKIHAESELRDEQYKKEIEALEKLDSHAVTFDLSKLAKIP